MSRETEKATPLNPPSHYWEANNLVVGISSSRAKGYKWGQMRDPRLNGHWPMDIIRFKAFWWTSGITGNLESTKGFWRFCSP